MDATLLMTLGVAAALGTLFVAARRAILVAELDVSRGQVRVVRGGIAPPVLADLRDVAASPPIERLRIRIVHSAGRADVELRGSVDDRQRQRIRNVIGAVPLARLANARRRKR